MVTLASGPTAVDYGSLAVLVGVVEAYYVSDLPGNELWRRLGRRRLLTILLLPHALAVLLLAIAPRDRYIVWWFLFLAAGLPAFAATVSPPVWLLRRRRDLIAVWPGPEERAAVLIMAFIGFSALAATAGAVVLALVTQDVRFALACALAVAFLLRWTWVVLVRRRFPTAATPAT